MKLIDKLLHNYEESRYVIKLKTRFLLYLNFSLMIIIPVAILLTIYVQSHNPALNYSINVPMISMTILVFFITVGTTALLVRGHFVLSAHLTISILFAAIWGIMFIDNTDMVSRIDTISMAIALLSATPIFTTRRKFFVLVYAGVNLCMLYVFMFYFRGIIPLPEGSFLDYLVDNTWSFLFVAITSYNILSISNRALEQSEISNNALLRSNEELQSAMEELTAANEEFEAQNEELMRSEEALRFSEAELLSIFNSAHDAMIIFDLDGRILDVNDRMLDMYGVDRARALSLSIGDLSGQDPGMAAMKDKIGTMIMGERLLYEWKARRPGDNVQFEVEAGVRRLKRRGKDVILAVVRDISDRKQAEQALKDSLNEKIILIKEIHHRVKNNMQVISSLLNMQADTVDEPIANQALKDAVGRIHSMASIHERIYSTDNFSRVNMATYIDELSRDLVTLHSGDSGAIQITPDMKPVFMGIDRAIPCGLLINEILTNSIKHGCREADPCRIDLCIEESGGWITIVIADHGPGMSPELYTAEQKTSMGMQIIDALARQINATVQLDVSRGTSFTLRIPSEA